MEVVNTTIFSMEEIERFIIDQFDKENFIITQISDRHYKNRHLPEGRKIIDVQIGYPVPNKYNPGKPKIKKIENLTLVLDIL